MKTALFILTLIFTFSVSGVDLLSGGYGEIIQRSEKYAEEFTDAYQADDTFEKTGSVLTSNDFKEAVSAYFYDIASLLTKEGFTPKKDSKFYAFCKKHKLDYIATVYLMLYVVTGDTMSQVHDLRVTNREEYAEQIRLGYLCLMLSAD